MKLSEKTVGLAISALMRKQGEVYELVAANNACGMRINQLRDIDLALDELVALKAELIIKRLAKKPAKKKGGAA